MHVHAKLSAIPHQNSHAKYHARKQNRGDCKAQKYETKVRPFIPNVISNTKLKYHRISEIVR